MFDISAKRGGVSIKTNIVAHTFDDNFNNIMPDKSEVPLFHKLLRFQTCVEKYFFNVTFRVRKYQFCFKVTKIFGSIFIPGMRKKQKHLTREISFYIWKIYNFFYLQPFVISYPTFVQGNYPTYSFLFYKCPLQTLRLRSLRPSNGRIFISIYCFYNIYFAFIITLMSCQFLCILFGSKKGSKAEDSKCNKATQIKRCFVNLRNITTFT